MKFTQNGFNFTDEENPAKLINEWEKTKKLKLHAFNVIENNGYKTIVLYDDKGIPIFESQTTEGIACHIDIMDLTNKSN